MMRNKLFYGLIFLCLTSLSACSNDSKEHTSVSTSSIDTLENEFAKGFQIIYFKDHTKINVLDPISQEIIQEYVISDKPIERENVIPHTMNQVVVMATSQIGILRKLHLDSVVIGLPNYNDLCHPVNHSKVREVGYMHIANPELFLKLNPDLIFYSGYNLSSPLLQKIKDVGLQPFLIYDWKETNPLGRAEWIKVIGVLFQKEKEAAAIFNRIEENYRSVVRKLNQATTQPTVLAGTYFNDIFNAPAGESYMATLLKDANADYIYSNTKGTGSISIPLEKVILENSNTEFWLNAAAGNKEELFQQNEKFQLIKATNNGNLYSYFLAKNCFFEDATIHPDIVLKDIGKIIHPALFKKHELVYYSKLE